MFTYAVTVSQVNRRHIRTRFYSTNPTHAQGFLLSFFDGGDGAEAATTQASRRSKRVTRGQPATPEKIESDTSHKIWRHPDRYFPYSLV